MIQPPVEIFECKAVGAPQTRHVGTIGPGAAIIGMGAP